MIIKQFSISKDIRYYYMNSKFHISNFKYLWEQIDIISKLTNLPDNTNLNLLVRTIIIVNFQGTRLLKKFCCSIKYPAIRSE